MRAKLVGGSLDGTERDYILGRRYIVDSYRMDGATTRVRTRETYVRDGHNGKFDMANPEGPHPDLVFTYKLESVEDWP